MERDRGEQPRITAGEAETQRWYDELGPRAGSFGGSVSRGIAEGGAAGDNGTTQSTTFGSEVGEKGTTENTSSGVTGSRRRRTESAEASASAGGLVVWLQENFDRLDTDKSGKINKFEIEHGMIDPKFATAGSAVYLSALHDQIGIWNRAFESDSGSPGYSRKGIEQYDLARKDPNLMQSNQEKLDTMHTVWDFTRVDKNLNGFINREELDKAIANPGFSSEQRRVFELAKKYYDQLLYVGQDRSKDTPEQQTKRAEEGINKSNLNDFPDPRAKEVVFMRNSIGYFNRRLDQLLKNPDQIASQGLNNGCFFLSPAIQLQSRNPQAVKDMIKDNPDGTRTVVFPGLKDKPITVPQPTEAEMITYANNRDISTLEKAFAVHWHELKKEEAEKEKKDKPEDFPALGERLQFGTATSALELLYGKGSEKIDPEPTLEMDLHDWLADAAKKNKPIILASKNTAENEAYGLTARHSFMASYDPGTRILTVRNPLWYNGDPLEPFTLDHKPIDGKDDREFKIGLAELRVKFFEVATIKD